VNNSKSRRQKNRTFLRWQHRRSLAECPCKAGILSARGGCLSVCREHLSGIPLRPLPDGKIKDGTNFSLHAMRAVTFTMNSRPASFESFDYIAVGKVHAAGLAKTRLAKSVLDAGWSSFRQHMLRYQATAHEAWYEEVKNLQADCILNDDLISLNGTCRNSSLRTDK